MLDASRIHALPQLTPPVLTLYLSTNPALSRNQGHPPGYLIWLKSRAQVIGNRAPAGEQKLFREQVKRVEKLLREGPPKERGLVLFAGPQTWELLPLQVDVEDELHWGRPSLTQLLWLLDEYQPCGVVLADRSGARFFRYWLGFAEEQAQRAFELDTSQWRKTYLVRPARPGGFKTGGTQRDVFEQRVEAHYDKFYREAAERIRQWAEQEKLFPVFLIGPNAVVEPVWTRLPKNLQEHTALLKGNLSHLSLGELEARLQPEFDKWKREYELDLVQRILSKPNNSRAIVGLDATLERLQRGETRALVVARGLGGRLRQCANCGWVDRSADRICPTCGGERGGVALRAVIPELARRFAVPVEVVAGEAATKLREAGGLAAWLR